MELRPLKRSHDEGILFTSRSGPNWTGTEAQARQYAADALASIERSSSIELAGPRRCRSSSTPSLIADQYS